MIQYFAYGSNMDKDQIEIRCPMAKQIGIGIIANYRIDFTRKSTTRNCGVADIVESPGDVVWGIIYSITEEDLKSLDRYEGYPHYYTKKTKKCFQFVDPNPELFFLEVPAQQYYENLYKNPFNFKESDTVVYEVVNKSATTIQPSIEYLHLIQAAAQDNYFPMAYQIVLNSFGTELRNHLNSKALDFFIELSDTITRDDFNKIIENTSEFGGADLVITGSADRKNQLNKNYELDLVVLTPFWKELSWIVSTIYKSKYTKWLFNVSNKYIYFKEFGESILEYQKINPNDEDHIGICKAGIAKAYYLLTEGGLLYVE